MQRRAGHFTKLQRSLTENRSVDSSILSLATTFSNNLEGFEKGQPRHPGRVTNG